MKARFYGANGRVVHEQLHFERTIGKTHYALLADDGVRWFEDTGHSDPDGWLVLREDDRPPEGNGLPKA